MGKNSTMGEKTAERIHSLVSNVFGGKTVIKLIGLIGLLVILVGGFFWYKQVYSDPENVFWGMVKNNLSTPSVTKEISQDEGGNTNRDLTQLSFSPTPVVRAVKEASAASSGGTTNIKIENIGTPTDTYQHYVLVDQPASQGKKKPDFSKVYPLWLKNSGNSQGDAQLFNNAFFGAQLFGNLPPVPRETLINYLRSAYKVDFSTVDKRSEGGRKVYTFTTKINLRNYAKAANYYAKIIELPNASQIKADNYKATDEVSVNLTVDVLSRQLRKVEYESSATAEKYISYGILVNTTLPSHTVSYDELQKAVKKAAAQ